MTRKPGFIVALAIGLISSGLAARAQTQTTSQGPPNALQGFSATLEVRDKQKQATFSGDVRVKQGDTGLRCKSLVVFYEQSGDPSDGSKTLQAANPGPSGEQRIKRLEARGGVVVTQKDQTATGELGIFDMKTNTVTLTGNPVVMTQGQNVLRGGKLVVDLTSGVSRVEAGKSGQGVQMLVQPGASMPDPKSGSADGQSPRPIPVRPFN